MPITYNYEYPRRLRAAMIGCGGHAVRNILPAFVYAPIELAAVCDLDRERAAACARLFGAESIWTDYRDMLDKVRPEAVFAVTNYDLDGNPRYPAIAMDAMRAGAHAWIEKPPASSAAKVLEMIETSRATGKIVGVGFKKMFFPANRKAREIVSRESFGGVSSITARYPQALPPCEDRRDPVKMIGFLDHMVHPHSVLHYFAGPIDTIYVQRNETGAAVVAIRFVSGAVGSLHLSHGQSGNSFLERTEIVGRGGNVLIENNLRVTHYRPGGPPGHYGRAGAFYGPDEQAPLSWEPEFSLGHLYNKGLFLLGYAPEILDFCECALSDKAPEWGNLGDALEIMRVYEAYLAPDGQVVQIRRE